MRIDAADMIGPVVKDLTAPGATPVIAVESALEALLFERTRATLQGALCKPPNIIVHPGYFKDRYASLHALCKSGYMTWYPEVHFATAPGDGVAELPLEPVGIEFLPIDYGFGVKRTAILKQKSLKTQINHQLRINHVRLPGSFFEQVSKLLKAKGELEQPLIANFFAGVRFGGVDFEGLRAVAFDHMLTGARVFCSCARGYHAKLWAEQKAMPQDNLGSVWSEFLVKFKAAVYADGICHLCISRASTREEAARRYGPTVERGYAAYIDQVAHDLKVDLKSASAEIQHVLGLSRWVRESELYGVIRALFPDQRVLREASPPWLQRLRLDVYLPELQLALEHQGEQHYRPIAAFGGEEAHRKVLERDDLKRRLCIENGVTVIDVRFDAPITKASMRQRLQRYLRPQGH